MTCRHVTASTKGFHMEANHDCKTMIVKQILTMIVKQILTMIVKQVVNRDCETSC